MDSSNPTTPQGVLALALARRDRWDYPGVAALCDPASARRLMRGYCSVFRIPTLRRLRAEHPDLTPPRLAGLRASLRDMVDEYLRRLPDAIPGVTTLAALRALEPLDFLARWLDGNDPRRTGIAAIVARGYRVPVALLGPLPHVQYVIGSPARDGRDTVRVSYHDESTRDPALGPSGAGAERLRRGSDRQWRLLVHLHLLQPEGGTAWILSAADLDDGGPDRGLVDPEELPFTRQELYGAFLRLGPVREAARLSDHLASQGPDAILAREELRARAKAGRVPRAETMLQHAWVYPPELLSSLAALGPDVAARVEKLQRRLRDDVHAHTGPR